MEHEEREEIPWSRLIAETESGLDKRWIAVGGAAAILIVAILGFRVVGSRQPTAPVVTPEAAQSTQAAPTTTPPDPGVVVTEAELLATEDDSARSLVALRAEWFVHDWFTVDGSEETIESILGALAPDAADVALPHADTTDRSYVEWARAFDIEPSSDGSYVVDVAYRSIIDTGAGFERRPVAAVRVRIVLIERTPMVDTTPEPIEAPFS